MSTTTAEHANKLTQEERRERRKQMASAVKAGTDVHQVARDFGVTYEAVRRSCIEHGFRFASARVIVPIKYTKTRRRQPAA